MGKTYRANADYKYFRKPKTQNYRKKLHGYVNDVVLEDYTMSKLNRSKSLEIPSAWDDIPISSRKEGKHSKKF